MTFQNERPLFPPTSCAKGTLNMQFANLINMILILKYVWLVFAF